LYEPISLPLGPWLEVADLRTAVIQRAGAKELIIVPTSLFTSCVSPVVSAIEIITVLSER
jgi:hypothetical protein